MSVFHSSAFPSSCYLALMFLAMRLQGLLTWIDGTDLHPQILVTAFCPVWAAFIELLSWFLEAVAFYCSTIWLQKVSSCKHRFPWQHNRKVLEQAFLLSRPAVGPAADPEHVCSCCTEGCAYRFPCFPQSLLLVGLATVLWHGGSCMCALLQVYPQSVWWLCLQACSQHTAHSYLKQQQLPLCCRTLASARHCV